MSRIIIAGGLWEGTLALDSRARRPIPNHVRAERPPAARRASVELMRGLHPAARLRSITSVYNCIGMVLASRRAWVDTADVLRVLQEDGYRPLAGGLAEAAAGDVVLYFRKADLAHAGVLIPAPQGGGGGIILPGQQEDLPRFWVLSKWGADGEYEHGLTDLPEILGTPTQFWTDRKEAP